MNENVLNRLPVDTLCFPLNKIESIVMASASFNGVRNTLTAECNPLTDPNALKMKAAIFAFFEQYQ